MPNHDYYKTLGVSKSASADEIRKAYKKLSKKYHPDANKEKDAPERFKQVQEAYDVLQDPEKREQYDRFGHVLPSGAGAHGQPFQWAGPGPGGAGPSALWLALGGLALIVSLSVWRLWPVPTDEPRVGPSPATSVRMPTAIADAPRFQARGYV